MVLYNMINIKHYDPVYIIYENIQYKCDVSDIIYDKMQHDTI